MVLAMSSNPADRLVAKFGSRAATAEHFAVSVETVRLWLETGIPAARALEAEEATRGSKHVIKAIEVLQFARQQREAA